jgi:DNA-binding NarL/FixJ family response regulator
MRRARRHRRDLRLIRSIETTGANVSSTLLPDEAERRLHLANTALLRALQSAPALGELGTHDRALLACLAAGMSHQQIGDLFDLSPFTVKHHITKLRRRINVPGSNRGEGAIAQLAAQYVAALVRSQQNDKAGAAD